MAYLYEYFNLSTQNCNSSTLKQETTPDEEINRTQAIDKKFNTKNGQELTMLNLKMDVLQIADVFENFVETSTLMYGDNPLYSYSAPGYTWKAGLKMTKIKLDFIKDKHLGYCWKILYVEEIQVLWVIGMLFRITTNKSYTLMQRTYTDGL